MTAPFKPGDRVSFADKRKCPGCVFLVEDCWQGRLPGVWYVDLVGTPFSKVIRATSLIYEGQP